MAAPLDYDYPPGAPGQEAFTAEDDLVRLLETLHASGTLRALNGLLARSEEVMAIVLGGLDTEGGRNGLSNLFLVARLLGRIEPEALDRFATAFGEGLKAAGARLEARDEPPGTLSLLKRLREPDVRRGLDAVLTLLGALGAQLQEVQLPVRSPARDQDGARA